jgi:signal transduction histidine kinase
MASGVPWKPTAKCAPDAAGKAVQLRGLVQDVTERVQTEQALRETKELLQATLDSSYYAVQAFQAVRDDSGQIVDFTWVLTNRVWLERYGGRMTGKSVLQENPGVVETGLFALFVQVTETGVPIDHEQYYAHGQFAGWLHQTLVRMGDGFVMNTVDITERKTAEQERLKNLRLLEQAEVAAGLGSWDYNLTTRQMTWSAGMYRLLGLPLGQPVGPDVYVPFVVEADRPLVQHLVYQLLTGRGNFEATLRLRVGEQVKTVRTKAATLPDETGQPVRVLGVDLDISELQRLEADNLRLRLEQQQALFEAVQAAQEAERKRMAESLHNGIGQILYATKLRLDQLHVPLPGTRPTLLAAWREADHLLAEAIRQTRALSHELVSLVLEEFGLPAALQDICRKMSTPELRFSCHVELDATAVPLAPPLQMALYRMAQELAQNVVKHALGATEVSLELETMPGWVLLRVADNGPGFGPTATEPPGLGLRSIRDRVALLGGKLDLGSAPTGGAYVRIRLPLSKITTP